MKQRLFIVGAGGFGSEALWVAERTGSFDVAGFFDDNPDRKGESYDNIPIVGTTDEIKDHLNGGDQIFLAIAKNKIRQRLANKLKILEIENASLIDPTVIMAPTASVGEGTFIGPGVIVAPHAKVGKFVLINTHVGIGHHSCIGDFSQICPGARISGGCIIEDLAFIGSNATLQPRIRVGQGASVGAGSYVVHRVKPRFSVVGVPARTVSRPAKTESPAQ